MTDPVASNEESRPDQKTGAGWAKFWEKELKASEKLLKPFVKRGKDAVNRYAAETLQDGKSDSSNWFRLNLFSSNVNTLKSMLYGQLPEVSVKRKFDDQDDDVARVAGLILSRMLNYDLQANGEEYDVVLRGVLEDRLLPGLGCAVVRYDMGTDTRQIDSTVWVEDEEDENGGRYETEQIEEEYLDWEDAEIDYHYWGDVRWSWARNWSELRWVAFRSYLTKEAVEERFGEKWAKKLTYKKSEPGADNKEDSFNRDMQDSVSTAEIWEIWDKESQKVFWFQENQSDICDEEDDPLGLDGFFPCPPFLLANSTTTLLMPTSDYYLAKDLYRHIDLLSTRIAVVTQAVKVSGVYDKAQNGLERLFKEATENELLPVDNWAQLAEKGGLAGVVDLVPTLEIAQTLDVLVQQRNQAIELLYQVTGMSDVLRGAATEGQTSATEQELKAKFASVRVQALQDAFATFCTDLMQLKAQVICKHYDIETIAKQANVQAMVQSDQDLVPAALQLLKQPNEIYLRIAIKPETVAMVDFAKKQQERTAFLEAMGFFVQSAQPMIEAAPEAAPTLLEMLKWGMGGFKGSEEIEGVMDEAIDNLRANPPQSQGDDAEAAKAQAEMAKIQGDLQKLEMQRQHDQEKHQFKMREMQAQHETKMAEIQAGFNAAIAELRARTEGKVIEQTAQTEGDIVKTTVDLEAHLEKEDAKADNAANADD